MLLPYTGIVSKEIDFLVIYDLSKYLNKQNCLQFRIIFSFATITNFGKHNVDLTGNANNFNAPYCSCFNNYSFILLL